MLSGVLEVIESVSSAIMSIPFQLSPYSEQEGPKLANIAPPPQHCPPPILFLMEQKTLGYNRNCQQFPRILGHCDAFFSHSV